MPTISLRLTDEEHAALKDWAHGSHRSMQREAVYRIFQERLLSERATSRLLVDASEPVLDASVGLSPSSSRSESDLHFKPDFK